MQVFPSLPIHTYNFVAAFGGSNSSQKEALRSILTAHAENQIAWSELKITGSADYGPAGVEMGVLLPYADDGSTLKSATSAFRDLVGNITGVQVYQNNYTTFANHVAYTAFSAADASSTEPPGIISVLSSRLMPRQLFTTSTTTQGLVDAVVAGLQRGAELLAGVDGAVTAVQVVYETPLK